MFSPAILRAGLVATFSTALVLSGCGGNSSSRNTPSTPEPESLKATLERTTYGVPHITAETYGGLGYGYGYAIAEDNLCVLADAFVTFKGERSLHFGKTAQTPTQGTTFGQHNNLDADFFFRFIANDETIETFKSEQDDQFRELVAGFAAGYNRYLGELQDGEHPGRHASCSSEDWLRDIDESDMYRRLVVLNLAGSSSVWVREIASAQPPALVLARRNESSNIQTAALDLDPNRFYLGQEFGIGSNTYSFGGDTTGTNSGINFANPHWYLEGIDRFYQVHLTLPGEIDIAGVSIMGAPMVLMGFNDNLAWAHTVSTARRFGFFALRLADDDPTAYIYDGQRRQMEATDITVETVDGEQITRTMYRSHMGPMINLSDISGGALGWSNNQAVTIRDVNLENPRSFQNFLAWNRANSLQEFIDAKKRLLGIPWVNTAAAGRDDTRAFYSDLTSVPNLPDSLASQCGLLELQPGIPLMVGSSSGCAWRTDSDSPQPGAFGVSKLPSLESQEYVANMNDSHWVSNPNTPLEGYAKIIGQERVTQSLRTRMGHAQALELINNELATSENVRDLVVSSRIYSAEHMKQDLLDAACDGTPITVDGNAVDVTAACDILDNWDNTGNLDARGALIWAQFWNRVFNRSDLYITPFSHLDPINTPNGLNTNTAVLEAFARTVEAIENGPLPLDAQVRDYQFYPKVGMENQIPLFGGMGREGYFTVLNNTYMHVVDFPDGQPVRAFTFLTHSQSTDPASAHYADYTQAYSDKNWHTFPFTRDAIEAALIKPAQTLEQ